MMDVNILKRNTAHSNGNLFFFHSQKAFTEGAFEYLI